MRVGKRVRVSCCLAGLVLLLSLAGCGGNPAAGSDDAETGLGPVNYDAPVAAVRLEDVPDVGSAVVYREVDDLQTVIAYSGGPALLVVYDADGSGSGPLITWVEQMAESYMNQALILLAATDSDDPYLHQLDEVTRPAFYVISDNRLKLQVTGWSDGSRSRVISTLNDLLDEQPPPDQQRNGSVSGEEFQL